MKLASKLWEINVPLLVCRCYGFIGYMRLVVREHTGKTCLLTLSLLAVTCLLITFTNSLDPDQDQQNVGPDLDPSCLTLIVFLKEFFEKVNFEKVSRRQQKPEKLPSMQRVNLSFSCHSQRYSQYLISLYSLKAYITENIDQHHTAASVLLLEQAHLGLFLDLHMLFQSEYFGSGTE